MAKKTQNMPAKTPPVGRGLKNTQTGKGGREIVCQTMHSTGKREHNAQARDQEKQKAFPGTGESPGEMSMPKRGRVRGDDAELR